MISKKEKTLIKKKLIDMGITVTKLANDLGVSRQYMSNIINGYVHNERLEKNIIEYLDKGEN